MKKKTTNFQICHEVSFYPAPHPLIYIRYTTLIYNITTKTHKSLRHIALLHSTALNTSCNIFVDNNNK